MEPPWTQKFYSGKLFDVGPSEEGTDSAAKKIKPEPELEAGAVDDSYSGDGDGDYGDGVEEVEGFEESFTGYEDMDGSELTKGRLTPFQFLRSCVVIWPKLSTLS